MGQPLTIVAKVRPIRIGPPDDHPAAFGESVGDRLQVELETGQVVSRSDRQVLIIQEQSNPFFFCGHTCQRSRRAGGRLIIGRRSVDPSGTVVGDDRVGRLTDAAAAFFDLDRTLISGSSVFVFAMAAWRSGFVPTNDLIDDARNAIGFRVAGASDEKTAAVRDRILGAIAGSTITELRALGDQVIPRLLKDVRLESRGLIDLHHDASRDTFIVSASPIEIVEDLARAMGMTGGIGTVAEVVDGVYTGRLAEPFCYGEGKAQAVKKLAEERGYDLRLSYAYSDSAGDLPFLEMVGHPVAVNPDRALQELAYLRGWPVVVFSRKAKQVIRTTTAVTGAVGLAIATYLLGRRHGRLRT